MKLNWILMHRRCPLCNGRIIRNNTMGTECGAMYCNYVESHIKLDDDKKRLTNIKKCDIIQPDINN